VTALEKVGFSEERLSRLSRFVDENIQNNRIAGAVSLVARHGEVVHFEAAGMMDVESRRKMSKDTIFRIASMTKPIATVAAMMLYEEGRFLLSDPVSRFIPELDDLQIAVPPEKGESLEGKLQTVPAKRRITIHDLLTHQAGFARGSDALVGKLYDEADLSNSATIGEMVKRLSTLPLAHQPGAKWTYGRSTDVLGYLIEVVSGKTLDVFLRERIFEPLGMKDTFFYLPPDKVDRFATLYETKEEGGIAPEETAKTSSHVQGPRTYFSAGGGLVSTALDYYRFLCMLLNRGELDGRRYLSPKSVELMTTNTLDYEVQPGYGFGLGFAIRNHLGRSASLGSEGEYFWVGIESTIFWVDPKEEIIGIFMTQLYPFYDNLQDRIRTLVYQALLN
jgi:CubicO group peptidase (beta-lactamase class C family)